MDNLQKNKGLHNKMISQVITKTNNQLLRREKGIVLHAEWNFTRLLLRTNAMFTPVLSPGRELW